MVDSKILVIFGFIILLSVIDIFANVVSFIPIIGDLVETASETVLETIQILLTGLLIAVAGVKR